MYKYILLISLFAAGCQDFCLTADYYVGGLCVTTNGYETSPEEIEAVIVLVEQEIQSYLDPDLDLHYALAATRASLQYVYEVSDTQLGVVTGRYHECCSLMEVEQIRIKDHGPYLKCHHDAAIFAHELMHFAEDWIWGSPTNHETPYMWLDWARQKGYPLQTTVQRRMNTNVYELCTSIYGTP
jgi:hypothetical protein